MKQLITSLIIVCFLYFPLKSILANDTLVKKNNRFVYGVSIQPGLDYESDFSSGSYDFSFVPRVQYFIINNMSLYLGADIATGRIWYKNSNLTYNIATFSSGVRYYFFKKKWLFAELGYQYGSYSENDGNTHINKSVNQFDYGLGLSFQLAHHPGIGKFTLEYLLLFSKPLIDYQLKSQYGSSIKYLGSGFGFHYYFDPTRPVIKEFTDAEKKLNTLHIIKASMNPSIDYTYELPLKKNLCLENSIIFNNLTYLMADTSMLFAQLNIEPRWYYGYLKRMQRNQITKNNSSDFLSVSLLATHPFTFVKMKNATMLTLLPKWGLRRAIGHHFIFELALGYGFSESFYDKKWYYSSQPYFNYYMGYVF